MASWRLFAFAPLATRSDDTELYVAVGVPPAEAYAEANRALMRMLAAVGIAGLLSVFAAWSAGDLFIVRRVQDRATRELRESEASKSAILEGALDGVITMDAAGHVVEFNPAAERTFGYTREQAVGQLVDDLIVPPRFRGDAEAALGRALLRGRCGRAAEAGRARRHARRRLGVPGRGLADAHRGRQRAFLYGVPARHHGAPAGRGSATPGRATSCSSGWRRARSSSRRRTSASWTGSRSSSSGPRTCGSSNETGRSPAGLPFRARGLRGARPVRRLALPRPAGRAVHARRRASRRRVRRVVGRSAARGRGLHARRLLGPAAGTAPRRGRDPTRASSAATSGRLRLRPTSACPSWPRAPRSASSTSWRRDSESARPENALGPQHAAGPPPARLHRGRPGGPGPLEPAPAGEPARSGHPRSADRPLQPSVHAGVPGPRAAARAAAPHADRRHDDRHRPLQALQRHLRPRRRGRAARGGGRVCCSARPAPRTSPAATAARSSPSSCSTRPPRTPRNARSSCATRRRACASNTDSRTPGPASRSRSAWPSSPTTETPRRRCSRPRTPPSIGPRPAAATASWSRKR